MSRWLYSLLLRMALPFAALAFLWRGWLSPSRRGSLRERLGWQLPSRSDHPLWLHAASVGEVRALAVLVRAMHLQSVPVLVTVATPTGLARARELFADLRKADGHPGVAAEVQALPWDLPGATRRFLAATRPRAAVFVESELWPNLIAAAARTAVPLVLVSARMSARSLSRYQRLAPGMMREAVRSFTAIAAQSRTDRDRFVALGADPARTSVGGNLKFDLQLPMDIAANGAQLRSRWASGRPLWVAGSTHAEEEAICLAAQRALAATARAAGRPVPMLVLAPRRPERFEAVYRWLESADVNAARVSTDDAAVADVLLLDVMGELLYWYAAADAALVGGTLAAVGGHNPLEPAALGKPVIAGPDCSNSPESAELLRAANALITVRNAAQLASELEVLLGDPARAQAVGERAAGVVAANRGAAARALALIASLRPV
jgi:3-deoxy-D-manno-octulosonic-acid transferase